MKCQNCGKSAMFGIGPQGNFPVCLDCYVKFQNVMDRQFENIERAHNQVASEIEMVTGFPGIVPRYPPRPRPTVLKGDTTLNNINISHSNIGVLNTGSIGTIDGALGVMQGAGAVEAAQALKVLTEAVAAESSVAPADKNKILELLSLVATEAAAPPEKRRGQAMRTILRDVASLLSGSAALAKLWQTLGPVLEGLF